MARSSRSGRPYAPRRPDRSGGPGRSGARPRGRGAGQGRPNADDAADAPRSGSAATPSSSRSGGRASDSPAAARSAKAPKKPRDHSGPESDRTATAAERLERARELRGRASSTRSGRARPANGPRPTNERLKKDRERDEAREQRRAQRIREGRSFTFGGLEISMRFLSIALLAGVLAALLVPNLYDWWRQEQDLRDITARVAAAKERNAQMEEELALWNDPEYIASQARERLGYVKPGETQYTVVDPGKDYQDQAQVAAAADKGPARPWVQVVGILLTEADQAETTTGAQSGAQSGASQSGSE